MAIEENLNNDVLNAITIMSEDDNDEIPLSGEEHESERKQLENHSLRQDIDERKKFADRSYLITKVWVGFLIFLAAYQSIYGRFGFGLPRVDFNVVFVSTTASVFGFWFLVGKYLFNSKK